MTTPSPTQNAELRTPNPAAADARLIEDSLPLAAISKESAREKSIRHGHISTLHIWWARRPLVACRAALYAALTPAPQDESEREAAHAFLKQLCTWEASNDPAILAQARATITAAHESPITDHGSPATGRRARPTAHRPRVLDMFAGGGAIPLEALRLGCEAYALDLNPVAHLIELGTLVYPQQYGRGPGVRGQGSGDGAAQAQPQLLVNSELRTQNSELAADVRRWGRWMLDRARAEIGSLYPAVDGRTPAAYLWARTVTCPNPTCRATVPLVRQTWLVRKDDKKIALKLEPDPATKTFTHSVLSDAAMDFDPTETTSEAGSIRCPFCGTAAATEYVREQGRAGALGQMPLAVVETGGKGKSYRIPNAADEAAFAAAVQQLAAWDDPDISRVDEPLPVKGTLGFRVQNYGLQSWGDLFNPRQMLALLTFARLVREAHAAILAETGDASYARAVATYLGLATDKIADYNSTVSTWAPHGEYMGHTFTRQAIPMIWDYAEINPFSGSTGDWEGVLDWISRVIEHSSSTTSGNPATVKLGSAAAVPYPDGYFDAVVSDPPYYDAVPYADLSDFFYVWLKRSLGFLYPDVFGTPLTPKSAEMIQEPARHGGSNRDAKAFFEQQMGLAFKETHRVLKDDGIAVIVYAHKESAAWETLLNALLNADLVVTASWPISTEMAARLRAQESAALASSFFLACRKRPTDAPVGDYRVVAQALEARVGERMDLFWGGGIRGADLFISAIGPAVEVFGRYRRVERGSGEPVGVAEMLRLVRRLVIGYALRQVFHGSVAEAVDPTTLFYVFYRYWYKAAKLPFGEILPLLVAMALDTDRLMAPDGILKREGSAVRLRAAGDRPDPAGLGEPGALGPAPLIDVLHAALLRLAAGGAAGSAAAADWLAGLPADRRAALWQVAQSLHDVLPDGDSERKALAVLLTGKERAERTAAQPAQDRFAQGRLLE